MKLEQIKMAITIPLIRLKLLKNLLLIKIERPIKVIAQQKIRLKVKKFH